MAICKCKMCGGDLLLEESGQVARCEYCGTTQTVPMADDEKKLTLMNRANRLRMNSEFDKAAGLYENVIADFPEDAEAYWCALLCKYGVEYVDDPGTGNKIPTCHRSSFTSVLEDDLFEQACEYADVAARRVYRDEAKRLETIRRGIIEVSSKEEPYDIFICYKETDENGDRTIDSAIAQDVYNALTEKGYRVFFARISLEDKLGQEYEPFIFAALHSAKIMLVFGTDYEFFNAVWVKNEWSRYLKLIAAGEKKTLIPCYKDIDAYDMPKEFLKLQSQDMGKVGAIQDLTRGIEKIIGGKAPAAPAPTAPVRSGSASTVSINVQVANIKKLGFMALRAGNNEEARLQFNEAFKLSGEDSEVLWGLTLTAATDAQKKTYMQELIRISPEISDAEKQYLPDRNALEMLRLYVDLQAEARCCYLLHQHPEFMKRRDFKVDDIEGLSLLDAAIFLNDSKTVAFLIKIGWDINIPRIFTVSDMQTYPLNDAIGRAKNPQIVKMLLEAGADPNTTRDSKRFDGNITSYSALSDAILNAKNEEIVSLLISAGADVNRVEHFYNDNDIDTYKSMLSDAVIDANNPSMVKMLLEAGADPNAERIEVDKIGRKTCFSVLSDAICNAKNEEIVSLLISAGADVNRKEQIIYNGEIQLEKTMLIYAVCEAKSPKMVQMLLAAGANPNCEQALKRRDGRINRSTPLSEAIHIAGSEEIVSLLISAGANVNWIEHVIGEGGQQEDSPILASVITGTKSPIMVQMLLSAGADPNSVRVFRSRNGAIEFYYSALTDAIMNYENDLGIVSLLISAGADVNRVERNTLYTGITEEKSMLAYAIIHAKSLELVKILLDAGADFNAPVLMRRTRVKLSRYPLDTMYHLDPSFLAGLRQLGWRGPGLFH